MGTTSEKIEKQNDEQRRYFEERSLKKNARLRPVNSTYVKRHVERLIGFGGISKGDRILDIGCGMGKYTLPLAGEGYFVEGLDLSPYLLAQLQTYTSTGLHIPLHCADILDPIPTLENRFDVVTGFFMLHHLVDIEAAFDAVGYYLKPGGRFVFLDVNPFCPWYYLQITFTPSMRWRVEKGIFNLTKNKLFGYAQAAGYSECESKKFGMLPPLLMNRSLGPALEKIIDKITLFRPVSAFQMFRAIKNQPA